MELGHLEPYESYELMILLFQYVLISEILGIEFQPPNGPMDIQCHKKRYSVVMAT